MAVQVGDQIPNLNLPDSKGTLVDLAELSKNSVVVLFFYPKNETAICTAEACSFRDHYEDFLDAGATLVGISSDSQESHSKFAKKYGLKYTLLSDTTGEARKLFGVPKTLGFFPGRVTYVIDKNGTVRQRFISQLSSRAHVEKALEKVRELV